MSLDLEVTGVLQCISTCSVMVHVRKCSRPHRIIEGTIAEVNTHLNTDPEKPSDEIVTL